MQIQNRGTIGGNVANASPAGDTLPVLAAADAVVVADERRAATRRIPFTAFYTGYRASVLAADELIVALRDPTRSRPPVVPQGRHARGPGDLEGRDGRASTAARRRGAAPRIALGSVAPTVVRLPSTEAALAAGASIDEAQRVLLDEIAPIDDVRSTAEYRRRVAANLLAQLLERAAVGR